MADGTLKVGTITNSAGSGNIAIGSGVTVNVNRPSFQAGLSSSQSIPNTTTTVVINDTEAFDTDSGYDTSTGIFTVPTNQGGKYYFYSLVRRNNWEPAGRFVVGIQKNGTEFAASDMSVKGLYGGGFIGSQVSCSAGDEIKPVVYHDDGAAANIFGTPAGSFTFFGGYKVGA